MNETVAVTLKSRSHTYEIQVGSDLLNQSGSWARSCLPQTTKKIIIISNRKVFSLFGKIVAESLEKEGFESFELEIGDGEKYKDFRTLEKTLKFFSENELRRSDAVIALGGGVVGDLAGLASSIYLRGVSFLQIPTTLLSMIDSSVGGKTAVNSSLGKNLIGTFHQPNGVLIDVNTLKTLARRELTAGFCEAVKQGAIADRKIFRETANFLKRYSPEQFRRYFRKPEFLADLQFLIASQAKFKADVVKGDERENVDRNDFRSRKILNFGHTVGHALEKVTNYKYFKHGEAVGLGMLVAGEISKIVANLDQDELNLLNDVVNSTGNLPNCKNIEAESVMKALVFDKKNIGESLQWILLEAIGKPKIVMGKEIPDSVLSAAIEKVITKFSA